MLTNERLSAVTELVDAWEQSERVKEEYPSDYNGSPLEVPLFRLTNEYESTPQEDRLNDESTALLSRACQEMGITLEELKEWYVQYHDQGYLEGVREGLVPSNELLERRMRRMGL